ncbi:unnamed protein product [Arabidopsis thaliana]|uniref:(thale cress) hypothetical protein n=1 Tax=Arabidopsis thaliana TaxID=3702 RepID=A0A7G2DUP2_ARATH|nr:unnamed protein product [Arabidopsis thaliana]
MDQIKKLIVPWKENMASNLLRRYDKDSESVTAQLLDEPRCAEYPLVLLVPVVIVHSIQFCVGGKSPEAFETVVECDQVGAEVGGGGGGGV